MGRVGISITELRSTSINQLVKRDLRNLKFFPRINGIHSAVPLVTAILHSKKPEYIHLPSHNLDFCGVNLLEGCKNEPKSVSSRYYTYRICENNNQWLDRSLEKGKLFEKYLIGGSRPRDCYSLMCRSFSTSQNGPGEKMGRVDKDVQEEYVDHNLDIAAEGNKGSKRDAIGDGIADSLDGPPPSICPSEWANLILSGREKALDVHKAKESLTMEKVLECIKQYGGRNVVVIDVSNKMLNANYLIILEGSNTSYLNSIAYSVRKMIKKHLPKNYPFLITEGHIAGKGQNWVVINIYGLSIHLLVPELRKRLSLEKLWTLLKPLRPTMKSARSA